MNNKLTNPQTKSEQIQGVEEFYLSGAEIDAQRSIPKRLEYVALIMFMHGECSGYRAMVVRSALKELAVNGHIEYDGPMYTTE